MHIARQLRKDNPIDYLIYMWQIEDMLRAANCEKERVHELITSKYRLSEDEMNEVRQWYDELIDMMRGEGKKESGHLNIDYIILLDLEEYHKVLLTKAHDVAYQSLYYQVLPSLIQLKNKNTNADKKGEIEILLDGLYGYLLLKMRKQEISTETEKAIKQISTFLLLLSERYKERDEVPEEE